LPNHLKNLLADMCYSVEDTEHTVYIAPKDFASSLAAELAERNISILDRRERLFLTAGKSQALSWAQNIWLEASFLPVKSISDTVRCLKSIQRNWAAHPTAYFRRTALIAQSLPRVSGRPLVFGEPLALAPLGAWTLWEPSLLLASRTCSSMFADGEVRFVENKIDPPGRAYLKLWEVFTLLGARPEPHELCVDLGSAPGGWTWVLASCGSRVISVDKAPLAAHIAAMPNVNYLQSSAFALEPEVLGQVDWLCCDVVCYPDRLLKMILRWLKTGNCRNFICTVKLQGSPNQEVLSALTAIPESRLMHLSHNRYELTWVRLEQWGK
jgi:23S rRNA (cytidine2498-2'-O)-methyltransferase